MEMVEEMHNLCEDIVTSRFERGETIEGIKSDTAQILRDAESIVADFGAERKKMSEELRSDLEAAVGAIQNETRGKLSEFGAARAEMSKEQAKELREYTMGIQNDVTGLLTDADHMMKDFAEERVKMGSELRKALEEYNSGMKNDVSVLLIDFANDREKMGNEQRKELGEYTAGIEKDVGDLLRNFSTARMEVVKELEGMHEEWQRMVEPRVEAKKKVEEIKEEIAVVGSELGELKAKVLEVINSSPGGISLTGIGLKLDVEWRKLIMPARDLLDERKITKEDLNYFPVKEEEET